MSFALYFPSLHLPPYTYCHQIHPGSVCSHQNYSLTITQFHRHLKHHVADVVTEAIVIHSMELFDLNGGRLLLSIILHMRLLLDFGSLIR